MHEQLVTTIYNLILNPATRNWERQQLVHAKDLLDKQSPKKTLAELEAQLRPLALRNNLTPDVMDFYHEFLLAEERPKLPQKNISLEEAALPETAEVAIFAGGCFWCMVEPFETRAGILSVESGYTGGTVSQPTYDQVLTGASGHVEAVKIIFDSEKISYRELVELYWQISDPTDALGQFQDRGAQYQPIIFVADETQRKIAEASKQELAASKKYLQPIVTKIIAAQTFWPAENYHQQFYLKEPKRYRKIKQARKQLQQFKWLSRQVQKTFK